MVFLTCMFKTSGVSYSRLTYADVLEYGDVNRKVWGWLAMNVLDGLFFHAVYQRPQRPSRATPGLKSEAFVPLVVLLFIFEANPLFSLEILLQLEALHLLIPLTF